MNNFFKILAYTKAHWNHIFWNIFFNFFFIVSGLFSLTLIMPLLKFMFMPGNEPDLPSSQGIDFASVYNQFITWLYNAASQDSKKALAIICVMLMSAIIIKNASRYLALVNLKMLIHKSIRDIKSRVFEKILRLPMRYFNQEKKGDLMSRMSNDTKEIEWSMSNSIEAVFKEPVSILVFMGTLVYMSPKLTLYVLLFLPVTAIIISTFGKKLKSKSKESQAKQGALLAFFEEILGGIKIIKSFSAESQVKQAFEQVNENTTRLNISVSKRVELASPISETLGVSISCILLWVGGNMVFKSQINPEVFIAYFLIFSQLIPPFKAFSSAFYNVQKGIASVMRIEQVMQTDEHIFESETPLSLQEFKHTIEFKEVCFSYGNTEVLSNINLVVPKGKKIALVGQSGSGKTTLTELLPRFYDVTHGEILIDGHNIKDLKVADLRSSMGMVSQESILFNDSIANNLRMGRQDASEDEMIEALKMANAWDFVSEKELGIHEVIGERGGKLSGGQKQRISIARALLKNPQILIMDEATSALDSESEKHVQDALNRLSKGRTTLVIAHRLSTILDADLIVVLDKGKLVEQGTHEALLKQNGPYAKLYSMQFYGT